MTRSYGSVSPKGQVTIPVEIREMLGLKAKDKVAFKVKDGEVRLVSLRQELDAIFMSVPALDPPRTWEEIVEIVREEHAQNSGWAEG